MRGDVCSRIAQSPPHHLRFLLRPIAILFFLFLEGRPPFGRFALQTFIPSGGVVFVAVDMHWLSPGNDVVVHLVLYLLFSWYIYLLGDRK